MGLVAVIDYGMGNLDSMVRALEVCGGQPIVTDRAGDIEQATHLILPGVGAFPDGMAHLREKKLDALLHEQAVVRQIPFLGVCLGMQLLAEKGYEVRETAGLGWIPGEVKRLTPVNGERIPHVGWNDTEHRDDCPLFRGIARKKDFYFVHSFRLLPVDRGHIAATTDYCGEVVSAVWKDNIFGVQFHPEKSQRAGQALLRNFLAL